MPLLLGRLQGSVKLSRYWSLVIWTGLGFGGEPASLDMAGDEKRKSRVLPFDEACLSEALVRLRRERQEAAVQGHLARPMKRPRIVPHHLKRRKRGWLFVTYSRETAIQRTYADPGP